MRQSRIVTHSIAAKTFNGAVKLEPALQRNRKDTVNQAPSIPSLLTKGHPFLEKPAPRVDPAAPNVPLWVETLTQALLAYREQTGFGRAIAAPQLGIPARLIVLHFGVGPIAVLNPEITWRSATTQLVWDDCLSVPDSIVRVERHRSISLNYQDANGRWRRWNRLRADHAELLQHEIDHLDGVLMTARAVGPNAIRPMVEREQLIGSSRPSSRLNLSNVKRAMSSIDPVFLNSPQFVNEPLSQRLGCQITLKIECMNPIRSFKGRGADFAIQRLVAAGNPGPLVAASAGNWGQALAYCCRKHEIPLTLFASTHANPFKLERMRDLGAKLELLGHHFDEAKSAAKAFAQNKGWRFLEDGLEPHVSEGHGTIAVELLDGSFYDVVLVPLGNGALANGVGLWAKAKDPATEIMGVCARGAPSMFHSWRAGFKPVRHSDEGLTTMADGIDVRVPIPEAVADMDGLVDDVVLVSDDHISEAMVLLEQTTGLMVEPAGAASLAAVIADPERFKNRRIAIIVSGSNRPS